MTILQVENLYFSYGKAEVLKAISLTMKKSMMVGILGGNGCGKSTLLKNISGYLKAESGKVLIYNKDIRSFSTKERAQLIGYVPQDMPYDFEFSCYDIVMMGRIPFLGRFQAEGKEDENIVEESMKITNTWKFKDKNINQLSGGERQRVYIARALAQKPSILLMDEPVSHLDIKYQIEILSLAKELSWKGILVITVLHDINLASEFCDEIFIMKGGKIMDYGSPEKVLNPHNIKSAFSIDVKLLDNPITQNPYVIPTLKALKGKEKFKLV